MFQSRPQAKLEAFPSVFLKSFLSFLQLRKLGLLQIFTLIWFCVNIDYHKIWWLINSDHSVPIFSVWKWVREHVQQGIRQRAQELEVQYDMDPLSGTSESESLEVISDHWVPVHVGKDIPVPPGVSSFKQWAATLVTMPIFRSQKWTFGEFWIKGDPPKRSESISSGCTALMHRRLISKRRLWEAVWSLSTPSPVRQWAWPSLWRPATMRVSWKQSMRRSVATHASLKSRSTPHGQRPHKIFLRKVPQTDGQIEPAVVPLVQPPGDVKRDRLGSAHELFGSMKGRWHDRYWCLELFYEWLGKPFHFGKDSRTIFHTLADQTIRWCLKPWAKFVRFTGFTLEAHIQRIVLL